MNVLLWIAQFVLAASFIWAGTLKLFSPAQELAAMWPWTSDNTGLVKVTGIIDILGGLGLILPGLLNIKPWLTIYTAFGIIVLMLAASAFHISRGEASQIVPNIVFAAVAAFIAWGRSKKQWALGR